ncbi:MAG: choice-of-anchor V domain-containing protein [Candidatus Eisenbacteria bacterium]
MNPRTRITRVACRWLTFAIVGSALYCSDVAWAYFGGPPDGFCGDPPNQWTCVECHFSYPLNSGPGTLALEGVPERYAPGVAYPIEVRLTQPDRSLWGFELTVVRDIDLTQAGSLVAVNPEQVQISEGPGPLRDYAKHTGLGTQSGAHSALWRLSWTAPPAGAGPVRFYVAGNVANANGSPSFDYIYALNRSTSELPSAGLESTSASSWRSWPEPMRRDLWLEPPSHSFVGRLLLLDASGRVVWQFDREESAGAPIHVVLPELPTGAYWLTDAGGGSFEGRRITVVR